MPTTDASCSVRRVSGGSAIQPGEEHLVDRRRQPVRLPVGPAALAVEQLLEEERVAGAALEDALGQLRRGTDRPAASSCAISRASSGRSARRLSCS